MTAVPVLPILILAAGQSRRMRGTDKLLEIVENQPLLSVQIARAQPVGPVYVAVPTKDHPRARLASQAGASVLIARGAQEGIGGTLRDGVAQLPACGAFMVMLPDLVDLQTDDLRHVADAVQTQPAACVWRGATQDGVPGHPVVFSDQLRHRFTQLRGDTGAQKIVQDHAACLVPLPGNRAVTDLDTPEAWVKWRRESQTERDAAAVSRAKQ